MVYIDASATNFYTPTVSVNYAEAVRALYSENITDLLAGVKPSGSEAALLSYDGIGALARCVAQANDVYAQELAWNDEDFLRDHPYGTLAVYWYPDEASRDSREGGVRLCGLPIDGLQTEQALYDAIAAAYAQAYVDGRMPDPGDIPDDLLSRTHVSRLTTITLNGREMTYDTAENPYASYGLTTDDYRFIWYNRDRVEGRGIGEIRPDHYEQRYLEHPNPRTLAQRLGARVLASPIDLRQEAGQASRELAREIKQMRRDFDAGKIFFTHPDYYSTTAWRQWLTDHGLTTARTDDAGRPLQNSYAAVKQALEERPPAEQW